MVEERIAEIYAKLEIHRVGLQEQPSDVEQQVRRSERARCPTEKMLEFKENEIARKERKFMLLYVNFKAEVQLIRSKLKEELSKAELSEMILDLEKYESDLKKEYEGLRALATPSQDIRRKMDSSISVISEIMAVLKRRYMEAGTKMFDAVAEKETLLQLLQREEARSIYGSTVSRAGRSSQQGSHMSTKRAEAAARLAAKRAEINREREISIQRKEVLAQQERLKMLENQRDLEVIEAEYSVYAEEELKLSAEMGDIEIITTLPPSQFPTQHDNIPPAQVPQSTSVPEDKTESASKEALLVQALRESLVVTKLLAPEPFVFTGDPLKFIEWSTCFKALIETNCTNPAHRLFYLKRYISGEALSEVEGMFYRSDGEAYTKAWVALNKRYGHPFVVQRAFRAKLSTWPKIGPRESLKLREFSDFLISCKYAMLHIQGLKILDDCEENQKLLQKLPDWLTTQWN
ncbi:uncharacterized protein LOC127529669 [Erpetoichthys calabaricus]|uniref:uncharacterized protein LOC127529669 n=1 Tax=Erpetoichthys calabaricus TaxID=27687 RepID=UPI0022344368|nr:uncharacterized protein LOC127529669 [Erpetoichthys calabaricus]